MTKKRRSGVVITVILVMVLLTGVGIIMYPSVSDQLNRYRQRKIVTDYQTILTRISKEAGDRMLADAEAYNRNLLSRPWELGLAEGEKAEYESILDITGTGVMGYIMIPSIQISLPIYHGTNDATLDEAIEHNEGSSFPVGGIGTHAVISGHRGLPSARLFTDIDQLRKGDHFMICVLDRLITYEVDQIRTVLPDEKDDLKIDPDQDYCTLVTCTPYGINTHRLLVRGTRVPNDEQEIREGEEIRVHPGFIILLTAAPVLLIIIIVLVIITGKNRKNV